MPFKCATACVAIFVSSNQMVVADEWVIGLGGYDLLDRFNREALAVLVEYHSDPFRQLSWADASWLAVMQADASGNLLAGAGVHLTSPFWREPFFWEASLAGVSFWEGTDTIKPAEDFLVRTSIGAGVYGKNGRKVSITLDHLLDSNLQNHNPGTETIIVRYTFRF